MEHCYPRGCLVRPMPNLLGGRLRWVHAATRRCYYFLDSALSLQKRDG